LCFEWNRARVTPKWIGIDPDPLLQQADILGYSLSGISPPPIPSFPCLLHDEIMGSSKEIKKEVTMLCSLSTNVDDSTLQAITDLEKRLGKTLLAFNCHDLKPSSLTDNELNEVQEAEKKLGVSLVAVEN
jgi:hypothetical protein